MSGVYKRQYPQLMAHPNNEHSSNKIIRPIPRRPAPGQQVGQSNFSAPGRQPPTRFTSQHGASNFPERRPLQPVDNNTAHRQQRQQPQRQPQQQQEEPPGRYYGPRDTDRPLFPRAAQQPPVQTPPNRWRHQPDEMETPVNRWQQQQQQEGTPTDRWQHPPSALPPPASQWRRRNATATITRESMMSIDDMRFPQSDQIPPNRQQQQRRSMRPRDLMSQYDNTMPAGGGIPCPMEPDPVTAQQPYGSPATPSRYQGNLMYRDEFTSPGYYGYQPEPTFHDNRQQQYGYDPYYHGNQDQQHYDNWQQPNPNTGNTQVNQQPAAPEVKEEVRIERKPEPDTTLKVITATIEGMKHWVQYKNTAPMLFQLIANLGSAVTTDTELSCHRFVLSDQKDSVESIFYDIDRPMPKVIRGEVYRCVGKMTARGDRFQCLSIRPATDSERRLHKATVTVCDKHLRHWVRQISKNKGRR